MPELFLLLKPGAAASAKPCILFTLRPAVRTEFFTFLYLFTSVRFCRRRPRFLFRIPEGERAPADPAFSFVRAMFCAAVFAPLTLGGRPWSRSLRCSLRLRCLRRKKPAAEGTFRSIEGVFCTAFSAPHDRLRFGSPKNIVSGVYLTCILCHESKNYQADPKAAANMFRQG